MRYDGKLTYYKVGVVGDVPRAKKVGVGGVLGIANLPKGGVVVVGDVLETNPPKVSGGR